MIRRLDLNKSQGYWNYLKVIRVNQLLLLFTVICLALLTATVQAAPVEEWSKTFGGTDYDEAWSVQQTLDGGYILAGFTYSYGAGNADAWLIKTDINGNQQWSKTFGGTDYDEVLSVQQTSEGGYILAGCTYSYGAGEYDAWLIKTDINGNQQWSKTFGGTSDDYALSVQQTLDGGYILAGYTYSYGAGKDDVWLIKTDTTGNQQWSKTFGGTDYDYAWSVRQTSDGGYVLIGGTYSYGAGNADVWLIKTDTNGNQQWSKTFGGTNSDEAYSVQQTSDDGYILAGYTNSTGAGEDDAWLIKTDTNGNQQWSKTFGGTNSDAVESVQQTSDGGYIIAGGTFSYGAGEVDAWLIKSDTNGNQQWSKTFGGVDYDWACSVQQTSDGGYIIAGGTFSYGAGEVDAWLIKVSSEEEILMPDSIGVYNNEGTWALWNTTSSSADIVGFGWLNTKPVVGDWDGDSVTEVGIYNTAGNNFLIQTDSGFDVIGLGWDGVTLVVGDWNGDGNDEVGVYNNEGTWALWNTTSSSADIVGFGWLNTKPVVGDWDGDGITEVGIYNTAGNNFLIQTDTGFDVIGLGWDGVTPVVGDWNGDGRDEVGVYNNEGTWALWNTTSSSADIVGFGWADTQPVVGDWDGDGVTEVGIYNTGGDNFFLRTDSGASVIGLGWSGVTPVVGCWS